MRAARTVRNEPKINCSGSHTNKDIKNAKINLGNKLPCIIDIKELNTSIFKVNILKHDCGIL